MRNRSAVISHREVNQMHDLRQHVKPLELKASAINCGLLALVHGEGADGRAGAGVAAGIGDFAAEERAQPRLDESPRAHVLRFFLAPDQFRVLRKRLDRFAQFRLRPADRVVRCE